MKAVDKKELQEELITRVRLGEQGAFDLLLSEYEPLLRAQVAKYSTDVCEADLADLRQTALLALYRAAMNFDLAQGEVEFGLYAKICISNALVSQLRVLRRHSEALPLPEVDFHTGEDDPARRVVEEEAATLLHARIRAVLSPYENRVWNLYIAGYRSGEIARLLGKEPHSVENAVYRIRQKLRLALGERG